MLRIAATILAVYLAGVLEYGLAPALAIGRVTPDWFAIALALAVNGWRARPVVAVALAIGLAADLNRGGHLGVVAGGMVLAGMLLEWLPRRLASRHCLVQVLATGLSAAVLSLWVAVLAAAVGEAPWSAVDVFVLPWARGLYSAAVAACAWMLVGWISAAGDEPRPLFAGQA